jgi:RNA polymerase sigma-70 factor (ECF subfamily)
VEFIQKTSAAQDDLIRLVQTAQAGDRLAFGQLFRRYERSVFGVILRRLGNYVEAQEVCQDVFIQAMRKIDQLKTPACFGGWLRSIAVRMAINRAMRRGPMLPSTAEWLADDCAQRDTPLGSVIAREQSEQLRDGLTRLTEMDRDTLVAFYFQGHSLVEMSQRFRSPVGTIKRRLHVARKRLAKELQMLATA